MTSIDSGHFPAQDGREDDLAAVIRTVETAKTSFYQAMRILPAPKRHAMFAIYAFCREVDDIADEPAPLEEKRAGLESWRQEINTIYAGGAASKAVGRALAEPIRRFGLLARDFHAVIDGMEMDAEAEIQAPAAAELRLYCDRVAGAVGRLSVRVFGDWRPVADQIADHLGRALQLTNILRDLDEDAARGRLYLPRELLEKHGIRSTVPSLVLAHPALDAACRDLAGEASQEFATASRLLADCPKRDMRPAAMMAGIYHAILRKLQRRGWTAPRVEVKLSKPLKIWIAFYRGYLG